MTLPFHTLLFLLASNTFKLSILYGTTTATYAMNLHRTTSVGSVTSISRSAAYDEETQAQTTEQPMGQVPSQPVEAHPFPLQSNNPPHADSVTSASIDQSFTEPFRVDILPEDFEPQPAKQTYYTATEQASKTDIEPLTTDSESTAAEKTMDNLNSGRGVYVIDLEEERKASTTVKEDGKVEREI